MRKPPRLAWHLRSPAAYVRLAEQARAAGHLPQADAYMKVAAQAANRGRRYNGRLNVWTGLEEAA